MITPAAPPRRTMLSPVKKTNKRSEPVPLPSNQAAVSRAGAVNVNGVDGARRTRTETHGTTRPSTVTLRHHSDAVEVDGSDDETWDSLNARSDRHADPFSHPDDPFFRADLDPDATYTFSALNSSFAQSRGTGTLAKSSAFNLSAAELPGVTAGLQNVDSSEREDSPRSPDHLLHSANQALRRLADADLVDVQPQAPEPVDVDEIFASHMREADMYVELHDRYRAMTLQAAGFGPADEDEDIPSASDSQRSSLPPLPEPSMFAQTLLSRSSSSRSLLSHTSSDAADRHTSVGAASAFAAYMPSRIPELGVEVTAGGGRGAMDGFDVEALDGLLSRLGR